MLAGCSPATITFTTSSEPAPVATAPTVPASADLAPSAVLPSGPAPTQALASAPASASGSLPAHVFVPYFETYTSDSLTDVAEASGVNHFTLAFLETTSKTSCALAWNGDKAQALAAGRYLPEIAALRAAGGDVIPSLGGWSADQGGTEIGDSCKDVDAIVDAYKELVTTYGVSRIDMDIEGRSLGKAAGHRPPQQGDPEAPGLGHRRGPAAHGLVHAADLCRPGSRRTPSRCSRTPSPTASGSTSCSRWSSTTTTARRRTWARRRSRR